MGKDLEWSKRVSAKCRRSGNSQEPTFTCINLHFGFLKIAAIRRRPDVLKTRFMDALGSTRMLTTSFHYGKLVVNLPPSEAFCMSPEIIRLMSETVVALFKANGRMLEWGDGFTASFGLTSARWQILGAIALAGQKQTAPQIAEQMGISRQGAQKQLNLLVEDGLIEKLPNPSHLRSPQYHLTDKGNARFQQVNSAWESHATNIGKQFSAGDLETTLRVLSQLAKIHGLAIQGEDDET